MRIMSTISGPASSDLHRECSMKADILHDKKKGRLLLSKAAPHTVTIPNYSIALMNLK